MDADPARPRGPRALIRSFSRTIELEIEGRRLVCFHGSPRSYDDVLLPETGGAQLEPWLADADLLVGGHTHRQWTRQIGRALFVNPGSIGLPFDHHQSEEELLIRPVAEYALAFVDDTGVSVEFRRVPYSLERVREVVLESGRPDAEAHLPLYGQR